MPNDYNRSRFAATLGQCYTLQFPPGPPVELVLEAIEDVGTDGGYETYTLVFSPPPGASPLADDTYVLHNNTLGDIRIFLSPTLRGGDPAAYCYEAVFSVRAKSH